MYIYSIDLWDGYTLAICMQNSRHLSYVFYSLKGVYEYVTLALMCRVVPMLEGPGQQTDALVFLEMDSCLK